MNPSRCLSFLLPLSLPPPPKRSSILFILNQSSLHLPLSHPDSSCRGSAFQHATKGPPLPQWSASGPNICGQGGAKPDPLEGNPGGWGGEGAFLGFSARVGKLCTSLQSDRYNFGLFSSSFPFPGAISLSPTLCSVWFLISPFTFPHRLWISSSNKS